MAGYPERYVVYDTETREIPSTRIGWDKEHVLRLGSAKVYDPQVYGTNRPVWLDFTKADELKDYLLGMPLLKPPIYIFAHNIGFDLRAVEWFRWVADGHFSLLPPSGTDGAKRYATPLMVVDGSPVIIRIFRADGQKYLLYDTFNWWQMSLARIGEAIGHQKGEMPPWEASDAEWFAYCHRDVEVLDRALRRLWGWLQCCRIPDWGPTPASVAMPLYRMRYGRNRIKKPEDMAVLKLDRLAYYGGRLECYRIGMIDSLTYQVDVNGLYPRVMLDGLYPCEVLDYDHSPKPRDPPHDLRNIGSTAEVYIDSPETPYPVRGLDGTTWCRGRVRTILAGPELQTAVTAGHVHHVGRWTHYGLSDLFTAYVRWLWRLRSQAKARGDTLVASVCKSLLNSLHGKFGQRDGEWHYCGRTETPRTYSSGKLIGRGVDDDINVRVLDGHFFTQNRDHEHEQSFVPIAAWTASYGRWYMEQAMDVAGRSEVYYQATDSLLVSEQGHRNLLDAGMMSEDALGLFKVEDAYRWVDIKAPNQLDHDHGWKHSGIKSGGPPPENGVYTVEEWQGFAEAIFQGNVSSTSTRKVLRKPPTMYAKRYVDAGGVTHPWTIDNWDLSPETQSRMPVRHSGNRGKK